MTARTATSNPSMVDLGNSTGSSEDLVTTVAAAYPTGSSTPILSPTTDPTDNFPASVAPAIAPGEAAPNFPSAAKLVSPQLLSSEDSSLLEAVPNGQQQSQQQKKVTTCQACTVCRQKKVRCDGLKPACTSCQKNGSKCMYVPSRRRGRPARAKRDYARDFIKPLPILPRSPTTAATSPTTISVAISPPHPSMDSTSTTTTMLAQSTVSGYSDNNHDRHHHHHHHHHHSRHHHHNYHQPQPQPHHESPGQGEAETAVSPPLTAGGGRQQIGIPTSPVSASEDESPAMSVVTTGSSHSRRSSLGRQFPLSPSLTQPFKPSPLSYTACDPVAIATTRHGGGPIRTAHQRNRVLIIPPALPLRKSQQTPLTASIEPGVLEYFYYFNGLLPVVHWPSFKEAYEDGTVPNYLIFAMRALSRRYSKQPSVVLSGSPYSAGQDLAAIATSLADIATKEDPNTFLVQTWLILSVYEMGMGSIAHSADRRRKAIQVAYELDIHNLETRAHRRQTRGLIVAENCRRVWWALFYCDRFFTLILNHPQVELMIKEGSFQVAFPHRMQESSPSQSAYPYPPPNASIHPSPSVIADQGMARYIDSDVMAWYQYTIPFSMIAGHMHEQLAYTVRLFGQGHAERPISELWADKSWLAMLNDYMRQFMMLDAEISQWSAQVKAIDSVGGDSFASQRRRRNSLGSVEESSSGADTPLSAHTTLSTIRLHCELQLYALTILHQILALYIYERLRPRLQEGLMSSCTQLIWIETMAPTAWKKAKRASESIRAKLDSRTREINKLQELGYSEPEWELCTPHMPFIISMSAKVHICMLNRYRRRLDLLTGAQQPVSDDDRYLLQEDYVHQMPHFVSRFQAFRPYDQPESENAPSPSSCSSSPLPPPPLSLPQQQQQQQQQQAVGSSSSAVTTGGNSGDGGSNIGRMSSPVSMSKIDAKIEETASKIAEVQQKTEQVFSFLERSQQYWCNTDYYAHMQAISDKPNEFVKFGPMLERVILELVF